MRVLRGTPRYRAKASHWWHIKCSAGSFQIRHMSDTPGEGPPIPPSSVGRFVFYVEPPTNPYNFSGPFFGMGREPVRFVKTKYDGIVENAWEYTIAVIDFDVDSRWHMAHEVTVTYRVTSTRLVTGAYRWSTMQEYQAAGEGLNTCK